MKRATPREYQAQHLSGKWPIDQIRAHLIASLDHGSTIAQQIKVRPRLVIFSYQEDSATSQLYKLACELGVIVSLELLKRDLSRPILRDRLQLLEKSRGIHGLIFPANLTPSHQACLQQHQGLSDLFTDFRSVELSPLVATFMLLAKARSWHHRGRHSVVLSSSSRGESSAKISQDLESLEMTCEIVFDGQSSPSSLSLADLVWLCCDGPINVIKQHVSPQAIIIDCSSIFSFPSPLSYAQKQVLKHRQLGFFDASSGLLELINLYRIHRLYIQALGPKKSQDPYRPSSNQNRRPALKRLSGT